MFYSVMKIKSNYSDTHFPREGKNKASTCPLAAQFPKIERYEFSRKLGSYQHQIETDEVLLIASAVTLTPDNVQLTRAKARMQSVSLQSCQCSASLCSISQELSQPSCMPHVAVLSPNQSCPCSPITSLCSLFSLPIQPPERNCPKTNLCSPLSSHLSISSSTHTLILVSCHGSLYSEVWIH